MTVEDLLNELKKYPLHYEVDAFLMGCKTDDLTSGLVSVDIDPMQKKVFIELAGDLHT